MKPPDAACTDPDCVGVDLTGFATSRSAERVHSMTRVPTIAFAVPRGFEDVASSDIARHLTSTQAGTHVTAGFADSGYVWVEPDSWKALEDVLQIYDDGQLWCTTRCVVCIGQGRSVIPDELLRELDEDRRALPSRRSREIKTDEPARRPDGRPSNNNLRRRVAPLQHSERSPGEERYLAWLDEVLLGDDDSRGLVADNKRGSAKQLSDALKAWEIYYTLRGEQCPRITGQDAISFAIRAEKREMLFPTLRSQDIARRSAETIGVELHKLIACERLKVNLENPEVQVRSPHRNLPGVSCRQGIVVPLRI